MRYSISNAIPHNPKSEKHPYENLVNTWFEGLFIFNICLFAFSKQGILAQFFASMGVKNFFRP